MNMKELREKNKLSQAALAKSIGVSSSAVASIESGRMKISQKISDKVKEVYGETLEPEVKKIQELEKKAEAVVSEAAETVKKVEETAKTAKAKAKATKEKAKTTAAKAKTAAVKADKQVKKTTKAAAATVKKALPKKTSVVIQSPMGGEITPEAILARVGDVDSVYVRIDENKAYWVKGEETGSVDLW